MAKFSGMIGFVISEETEPGIWVESVVERPYYGDLLSQRRHWDKGSDINDDITFNQDISILADPYALEHMQNMRYVIFHGIKWKITDLNYKYPRVRLSTGGIYNA